MYDHTDMDDVASCESNPPTNKHYSQLSLDERLATSSTSMLAARLARSKKTSAISQIQFQATILVHKKSSRQCKYPCIP